MRYSSLEERKLFYDKEFNLDQVRDWFKGQSQKNIFAVVIGRHSRIYTPEYEDDAATTIIIDAYEDLEDVRKWILEFRPESVYYDRNLYDRHKKIIGQQLAIDIDPENIICPIHGTLKDKMNRHQGLSFCETELKMVIEETVRLYEDLSNRFVQLKIVYSGRGFHIHILDEESKKWNFHQRKVFAHSLKQKGFLIDEWVTSGGMNLIRLPYSLHGLVSRIVTPLTIRQLENFDPVTENNCVPEFLKSELTQNLPIV